MKNLINLIIFCLLGCFLFAQEFEIAIKFEDSIGNLDSIMIGYDNLAGFEIEEEYGEIDILGTSFDDNFEIRVSIYNYNEFEPNGFADPRLNESKRIIVGPVCNDSNYFKEENSILVSIKCKNWPIKVSWDESIFKDECNKLEIVDCMPGGWFDVCASSMVKVQMMNNSEVSYTKTDYRYIMNTGTLSTLYFSFNSLFDVGLKNLNIDLVKAYPNPSNSEVNLNLSLSNFKDSQLVIFNRFGVKKNIVVENDVIDVSTWNNGVYYYILKVDKHSIKKGKFIVLNETR